MTLDPGGEVVLYINGDLSESEVGTFAGSATDVKFVVTWESTGGDATIQLQAALNANVASTTAVSTALTTTTLEFGNLTDLTMSNLGQHSFFISTLTPETSDNIKVYNCYLELTNQTVFSNIVYILVTRSMFKSQKEYDDYLGSTKNRFKLLNDVDAISQSESMFMALKGVMLDSDMA